MDTNERRSLRHHLTANGFDRTGFSDDTTGDGGYAESFTHPDGTMVTINWAPRTNPAPADAAGTTGADTETTPEMCMATNPDYPGEYHCTFPAGHGPVRGTEDDGTYDFDHGSPAQGAWWSGFGTFTADNGVTSVPGMYDEPDMGLDLSASLRGDQQ